MSVKARPGIPCAGVFLHHDDVVGLAAIPEVREGTIAVSGVVALVAVPFLVARLQFVAQADFRVVEVLVVAHEGVAAVVGAFHGEVGDAGGV